MSDVNPQICLNNLLGADTRDPGGEQVIRQVIWALHTKEDIQVLMGNLLGPLREEIGEIGSKVETIE